MRRTIKILVMAFIALALTPALFAEDWVAILRDIDELANFDSTDFRATYTVVTEKPGEDKDVMEMNVYRRDAEDKFCMIIQLPQENKGQGYLQLSEEVIKMYDPQSREFETFSLKENIEDSDANLTDFLESGYANDYKVVKVTQSTLGSTKTYVMYLEAVTDNVSYERLKIWVRQDVHVIMKSEEYALSGKLMRTTVYKNYVKIGEKLLPIAILMVDNLNEGEKTQMTMFVPTKDSSSADSSKLIPSTKEIDDYVFSEAFLRQQAK